MVDRRAILALAGVVAGTALGGRALLAKPVTEQVLGKADAPVTVVEYASLTCPHCAHFHKDVLPQLKARYIDAGKVKLVYRDFPLDQIALKAAVVAHCAGPERYFSFLNAMFSSQESWAYATDPVMALKQLARVGGLPEAEIDACLADRTMEDGVLRSRLDAQQQFKVNSTPSFVINGKLVSGVQSIDDLAKVIDPLLN